MPTIELSGTVTLYKGTGVRYRAKLRVEMITTDIGKITSADVEDISSLLIKKLIYLGNGVIYMSPENAIFQNDPSP